MSEAKTQLERAARLRAQTRFQEALALLDRLVATQPRIGLARMMRGLTLCNLARFEEGLADMHAAIALEPRNADFRSDLGLMLMVVDRGDEAVERLREALALRPSHASALSNLSLALRQRGEFAEAEAAAREAVRAAPKLHEARINLAYVLLAQGKFAEAWPLHSYRASDHLNLRDPGLATAAPHVRQLPASPSPLILHGEQGLGDTLFFLRFAPRLRARGHRLAFWGDARLHGLLRSTGHFEHCLAADAAPAESIPVVWSGDLPWLLGAEDPADFPPALPLHVDPARHEALRAHFATLGPPPYIGVTWRAGLARYGRIALSKEVPAEMLGRALRGVPGTYVSLQRQPRPGEAAQLAGALGVPLHDAAGVNERLEDALALVAALDEYVAVSNTNVHLRAGAGRAARVLVPWPPEWRWPPGFESSPWFPTLPLYRERRGRGWDEALSRLAADLSAAGDRIAR